MSDLSILCVTKLGAHAAPFLDDMAALCTDLSADLVIAIDGPGSLSGYAAECADQTRVMSNGCIESVLDQAVARCASKYVLRLDDDETASSALADWLAAGEYRDADHWAFSRMHLWPDTEHFIDSAPLWPDLQTRLSVKAKAGGRTRIHQGSPFGTGRVADVAIEHHKFLVRDLVEREALVEHYESLQPGAGGDHFARFSVPEWFSDSLHVAEV